MSDFSSTTTRKARKTHQCEECGRTIREGETYERYAGVWEGDFSTFVSCLHCSALRDSIGRFDDYFWEGAIGGVGEWVGQGLWKEFEMPFFDRLNLLRLTRQFSRRWTTPSGELLPVPAPEHLEPTA